VNKCLALLVSSFILAVPASAEPSAAEKADNERLAAITVRGHEVAREAESRAMEEGNSAPAYCSL